MCVYVYIYIYIYDAPPRGRSMATGVCEKKILWRRTLIVMLAFRPPNQGLESSFCHWTAWQGLAQKELFFSQTPVCLCWGLIPENYNSRPTV